MAQAAHDVTESSSMDSFCLIWVASTRMLMMRITAQQSTAKHSTAQHSTAQRSAAQHHAHRTAITVQHEPELFKQHCSESTRTALNAQMPNQIEPFTEARCSFVEDES